MHSLRLVGSAISIGLDSVKIRVLNFVFIRQELTSGVGRCDGHYNIPRLSDQSGVLPSSNTCHKHV